METLFGYAALTLVTLLGLFAALALQGLLLHAAFALMQPATAAPRRPLRTPVERGTQLAARAYAAKKWPVLRPAKNL